ncbi:DUF2442 domain-containing protein [Solitalea koreensis]|uniref:DUF2442 domain-containing protein n=1 Tax=Solitalea koreensis TaxID=543615 RepID=A0A521DTK2_9SPHI|nr:DUF2442 domain-containing protein [Solitalea koreensis]SMO75034.1 Protein of unknown function [Solitalea koreensis]
MSKIYDIISIKVLDNFRLEIEFDDRVKKIIDFSSKISKGPMSKALADPDFFAQVSIIEDGSGLVWPNGYDFCPEYARNFDKYEQNGSINQVAEPPSDYDPSI